LPTINNNRNKQQGLALITVLFIFALASMLVINIQQRQSLDIAQTSSTLALTQMQTLALSAEDIAKAGLILDMNRDNDQNEVWDTASEQWNQDIPLEEAGAKILVSVRDLQGLFNLNSLYNNNAEAKQRFQRLLDEVGVQNAAAIVSELTLRLDPNGSPYNVKGAGILLAHPSELLTLDSMELEQYKLLEPYITALPNSVALNINTAAPQVLASWDPALSLSDATTVINQAHAGSCGIAVRNNNVFKTTDELWDHANIKSLVSQTNNTLWQKADFSVNSQFFAVLIQVHFNEQLLMLESVIRREKGNFVGVIYRDFSKTMDAMDNKIITCSKI